MGRRGKILNAKGSDLSEDLSVDGRIILKWIVRKQKGCELDSCGSGEEPVAEKCSTY
jgi:hypothetical protein